MKNTSTDCRGIGDTPDFSSRLPGTVQFLDGGAVLGTASVSGGAAALSISTLAVGSHSLTAAYSGDSLYGASTSSALALTVNRATSSVTLVSSPNPAVVGQSVTFTATVAPNSATGAVQFLDGATVLGMAAVSGGTAALATSALAAGSHSITAAYGGDGSYAGSTSAAVVQTVTRASTVTMIASSANPSTLGQAVTFTVSVSPAGATGSVQFLDGTTPLGTVALNSGTAALTTSSLPVGFQSIAAVYSGDANYNGSTGYVNQSVTKTTTTSLTSDKTSITYGQAVTFTATVSPSSPTGVVQFMDGTVLIGAAILSSGQAKLSTVNLTGGTHSVTAVYTAMRRMGRAHRHRESLQLRRRRPRSIWCLRRIPSGLDRR